MRILSICNPKDLLSVLSWIELIYDIAFSTTNGTNISMPDFVFTVLLNGFSYIL